MTYAEQFREAFRIGFAPILSDDQLVRLAEACERDDPMLTQCCTTVPTSIAHNDELPVERCCMAAYVGGIATGKKLVGEVYEAYSRIAWHGNNHASPVWVAIDRWDRMPRDEALSATAGICRQLLDERKAMAA